MLDPELSILIVNWNSAEYVRGCLTSLACAGIEHRIQTIVVDAGSYDGCAAIIAREFPLVEFVQLRENVGFARANNAGFASARAERTLLLNPDTEIRQGALEALMRASRQLPKAGILGARLLNTDGSLQTSCVMAAPTLWNQALDSNFLRRRFPKSSLWRNHAAFANEFPTEVEAVSGACMLIPTALFAQVGGFSPDYFMYAEDVDLCAKVRAAGWKVYFVPEAEIVHHGGGSSQRQVSSFKATAQRQAMALYMRKHYGGFHAWGYRVFMGTSAVSRLTALSLRRMVAKQHRATIAASAQKWKAVLRWSVRARDSGSFTNKSTR